MQRYKIFFKRPKVLALKTQTVRFAHFLYSPACLRLSNYEVFGNSFEIKSNMVNKSCKSIR